jgi:hypothetical protein
MRTGPLTAAAAPLRTRQQSISYGPLGALRVARSIAMSSRKRCCASASTCFACSLSSAFAATVVHTRCLRCEPTGTTSLQTTLLAFANLLSCCTSAGEQADRNEHSVPTKTLLLIPIPSGLPSVFCTSTLFAEAHRRQRRPARPPGLCAFESNLASRSSCTDRNAAKPISGASAWPSAHCHRADDERMGGRERSHRWLLVRRTGTATPPEGEGRRRINSR